MPTSYGAVTPIALSYSCPSPCDKRVYLGRARWVLVNDYVYEPAEDTWQTIDCLLQLNPCPGLVVDVGTGSGAIALTAASLGCYAIALDVNPCAVKCAWTSAKDNGLAHVIDVAQCSYASCLRPCSGFVVFNIPYLPAGEEDESLPLYERLALIGGMQHAYALLDALTYWSDVCLVLTYSSLSGDEAKLMERLKRSGFKPACRITSHVFFEDIVSVAACKGRVVEGRQGSLSCSSARRAR